jgi:hypothetical protein
MDKPTTAVAPPETDEDLLDGVGLDDEIPLDILEMTEEELFADDPELLALLVAARPSSKSQPSEERSVITPEEKAQLARNIQDMDETEFVNDNLTRAVARYAPRELEKYVIPKDFPGWHDASWQSTNQTRMGMHSRAKAALGQTESPRGGQERPSGNGSITA